MIASLSIDAKYYSEVVFEGLQNMSLMVNPPSSRDNSDHEGEIPSPDPRSRLPPFSQISPISSPAQSSGLPVLPQTSPLTTPPRSSPDILSIRPQIPAPGPLTTEQAAYDAPSFDLQDVGTSRGAGRGRGSRGLRRAMRGKGQRR